MGLKNLQKWVTLKNLCKIITFLWCSYFRDYLQFAEMEFKNIKDTREPMMFPLSKLLLCVAQDEQTKKETLKLVKPLLEQVFSHLVFVMFFLGQNVLFKSFCLNTNRKNLNVIKEPGNYRKWVTTLINNQFYHRFVTTSTSNARWSPTWAWRVRNGSSWKAGKRIRSKKRNTSVKLAVQISTFLL